MRRFWIATGIALVCAAAQAQPWDRIRGEVAEVGDAGPHRFLVVRSFDVGIAHLVDGDTGAVEGTLSLSLFTPGLAPDPAAERIYAYGSYYTRMVRGERTDVLQVFDARSLAVEAEIEIPPKSAGIGHSGMIGLVDGRFVGVWNITPAMSVSIVDVEQQRFVGELSTPGCAAVYPVGRGFLMPCGDGTLQYLALNADGTEASRVRSRVFFDVQADPVFDYAVPTAAGWLFLSFEGRVFEATVADGAIRVAERFSLFDDPAADRAFRIGGNQPFAYNAATGLLVTLVHEGGGQETVEDPGFEVWAYDARTGERRYRMLLDEPATSVMLTQDAAPLLVTGLLVIGNGSPVTLFVHDAATGRKVREVPELTGSLIQPW